MNESSSQTFGHMFIVLRTMEYMGNVLVGSGGSGGSSTTGASYSGASASAPSGRRLLQTPLGLGDGAAGVT